MFNVVAMNNPAPAIIVVPVAVTCVDGGTKV